MLSIDMKKRFGMSRYMVSRAMVPALSRIMLMMNQLKKELLKTNDHVNESQ